MKSYWEFEIVKKNQRRVATNNTQPQLTTTSSRYKPSVALSNNHQPLSTINNKELLSAALLTANCSTQQPLSTIKNLQQHRIARSIHQNASTVISRPHPPSSVISSIRLPAVAINSPRPMVPYIYAHDSFVAQISLADGFLHQSRLHYIYCGKRK